MDSDKDFDPGESSRALYDWWLGLIPSVMRGVVPQPPADADEAVPQPFPIGQLSQALALCKQLLGPLYQGYMQSLLAHPKPEQAFGSFFETALTRTQEMADALGGMSKSLAATPATAWGVAADPMAAFGQALKPLSLNLERAYGGLGDAFGLAPSREMQAAVRDMATAAVAKQQAQAQFAGVLLGAFAKGAEGLRARLGTMGRNGESVDSLLGLVRLWAQATEGAVHAAMQSPKALEASTNLIRAGTRSRQQQQRAVALVSEALNVPTRAEVDEAYREIQELKREMRRLRKFVGAPATVVAPVEAEQVAVPVTAPAAPRRRAASGAVASKKARPAVAATAARRKKSAKEAAT